jgi:SPP1 gp7 family putative phage head morphogenesis protein
MILRLDPDDDDAEDDQIQQAAQEHIEPINRALQNQLDYLTDAGTEAEIRRRIASIGDDELRLAVEGLLRDSAGRGVRMGAQTLERVMGGVNWMLPHSEAMGWAHSYSYELVSYINSNSRQFLAEALAEWVRTGGPMGDLVATLAPRFGIVRAEMIAVTESTRAYAEGSRLEYRQMGIRRVQWLTNRDDRVCPICLPLDNQIIDIDQGIPGIGFPPAHVNCRCFIAPVVER